MQADRGVETSRRSRLIVLFIVLLIASCLAGTQSAFFSVRSVEVKGLSRLKSTEVLAVGGVSTPFNVFRLNPKRVRERLQEYPPLASVEVTRILPDRLVITVSERVPVGAIPYGRHLMLFDAVGVPFAIQKGQPFPPVPVLVGMKPVPIRLGEPTGSAEVELAARMIDGLPREVAGQTVEVDVSRPGRLGLTLASGVRVELGDDTNLARKIGLLESILIQVQAEGWRTTFINLAEPDDPVVKLGAVTAGEQSNL